jgi:hypothetical protein
MTSKSTPPAPPRSGYWTLLLTTALLVALAALWAPSLLFSSERGTIVSVGTPSGTATASASIHHSSASHTTTTTTTTTTYTVDMDKTSWPEVVGTDGATAARTIRGENPAIALVPVLPQDSMVTMDYNPTRVRIFVNDDQKVARTPQTG